MAKSSPLSENIHWIMQAVRFSYVHRIRTDNRLAMVRQLECHCFYRLPESCVALRLYFLRMKDRWQLVRVPDFFDVFERNFCAGRVAT